MVSAGLTAIYAELYLLTMQMMGCDWTWGYEGYGNLRWRHYLMSKLLTLMLLPIALVHLKPSWSLELKRRRGSMNRL